jgi:hypothetical protein
MTGLPWVLGGAVMAVPGFKYEVEEEEEAREAIELLL